MADFLFQEFCNHAYLGQWELSRGCAFNLIKSAIFSSEDKLKLISMIQSIMKNPYLIRSAWPSLPCPNYCSFFMCHLLYDLGYLDEKNIWKNIVDFNIILEMILESPEVIVKEFSDTFCELMKNDINLQHCCQNLEISKECITAVKSAFKENPLPVSILINKMCFSSDKDIQFSLKTVFCDVQLQLLLNTLKSAESAEKCFSQVLHNITSKIYLLLSILSDLDVKYFQSSLEEIYLACLDLCDDGILELDKIYSSLIGRKSPALLKHFCDFSSRKITLQTSQSFSDLNKFSFVCDSGCFKQHQSLLWILYTKTHILQYLMDHCIESILMGNWKSSHALYDVPASLGHLCLILSWEKCNDDSNITNVIEAVKMWNLTEQDSIIAVICKKLKLNVQLSEMCIAYYMELYPNSTASEISSLTRRIFSCLQTQSFLKVLHSVFDLKNVLPQRVENMLKYSQENVYPADLNQVTHLTDKSIYSGYRVMTSLMEAIYLSKEFKLILLSKNIDANCILYETLEECESLDSENHHDTPEMIAISEYVSKHNCQKAYSKFIVEKLENARLAMKDIFPLSFRVEILENTFSLLFLTVQNLVDDTEQQCDSDQGYEDEISFCDRNESFPLQFINRAHRKTEDRFIISTTKLKFSEPLKNVCEHISDHLSSKSESGTSNGFQDNFLCTELITRDLLYLLKDCVLEAKAEIFKLLASQGSSTTHEASSHLTSSQPKLKVLDSYTDLPERTSRLLDYVNEALWRNEVVKMDIFQERIGYYGHQKIKPHLFQFQFSSSSEGTDKESKKNNKKKRHKSNSLSFKDENLAESSIIQCMLSSPEALLCYSLWNKNEKQASQVIQLFNLENSLEAKEFSLITELSKIAKNLVTNDKLKMSLSKGLSVSGAKGFVSNISSIKSAATHGLHSSDLYMTVIEELSSLRVLKLMDITGGVHHPELLLGSRNIFSVLLIDLACVTDISVQLASSLLDSANKNWEDSSTAAKDLDVKVLPKKKLSLIRGNSKTLDMINSVLKEILVFFQDSASETYLGSIFWPLKKKVTFLSQVIPHFLGNLNHQHFMEEINDWKKSCKLIEEFSILLENEELNERKGILLKDINRENKLHMTYKKLSQTLRDLRDWSSNVVRPDVAHYNNYLSKLLIHLRQVTIAALECKNQSNHTGSMTFYTSDFSILKESPVEILKKVILQSGVSPKKVETFAIRMKVDLPQVLAHACLPYVPLFTENVSFDKLLKSTCQIKDQGYPFYILNVAKSTWPDPQHPDLVARELVKDIISMIQETAMVNDSSGIFTGEELLSFTQHSHLTSWMEDCSQLAFVDLNLLKTREEKLAFFINVNNIAWIYAIVLQTLLRKSLEKEKEETEVPDYSESNSFNKVNYSQESLLSSSSLERLTSQKILGFSIGQVGPVSLFDLRYYILHDPLPVPKHLETPPFNKLIGDKSANWARYMPPPEPRSIFVLIEGLIYSPKLQALYSEDIDNALENAMKDYLDFTVHIDVKNDKVLLPHLLEWYAKDFSKDDENCLDKAQYEGLINLLSTSARLPLSDQFQELLSADSAYNFSENIDSFGNQQLPFCLEFKSPAASLGIILEYSDTPVISQSNVFEIPNLMDPQPVIISYLKEKCQILTDLYDIIINDNSLQNLLQVDSSLPVFNLLKHYGSFLVMADNCFSWFSSALSSCPSKRFYLQQIECSFIEEKWSMSLFYLNLYLEYCGKNEFDINLSRQLILQKIASIIPSTPNFDPSSYALCISDPVCRATTVLENINNWTEYSAVKALKYCLSESKLSEFTEIHQSLKHKLREINLYKKIVDASELYNSEDVRDCVYIFNNWQEVADFSVWGQARILELLHSCERYDLAVEWAELNTINSQQRLLALSMNLMWHFSQNQPYVKALKILDFIGDPSEILELCDTILPQLTSVEAKLCVVQYIVDNIPCENLHFYHSMLLGLKMLSSVKPLFKETYSDLAGHPYLLLEQMLMNVELKDAEKALKAIEKDLQLVTDNAPMMNMSSVNQLVEDYASKALEVHFLDALLDGSTSSTVILSFEDSVVPDEPFVMPVQVPTKGEWVPDAKILCCQVCKEEHFNMFTRRHHCRRCGRVVCANCSQHALIVEGYGNVKVRVCEDCYNGMTGSISVTSSSFDKRYRILSSMQSSPRNSPYSDALGLRRKSSSPLAQHTFRWMLSSDCEQNASIRNEFNYEQAPSLSLCYSILKLHGDPKKCAQFMLNLCDRLLGKIKPRRSGKIPIEVDYSLIISMIKSLLVSAKLKCQHVHDTEGEALADLYFQHLDVMKLLVNANCRHLLPREALTSSKSVRKLRDKLLEEERMSLALEVSTKFGLDKSGVWSSWGFFCIRAGDLIAARTKFQQCLKIIRDKNDPKQESPLLNKILQVLESSNPAGVEKASAIYKSLSNLRSIASGATGFQLRNKNIVMEGLIKKECLYYLNTYGTHISTVRFYQRHDLIHEALSYISEKKCDPEIFIEAIFMPMLKHVQLAVLRHEITSFDPSLRTWWNYLFTTCRHLERLKYLNVLYEIQLFMEDYARAAKSAINFYLASPSSYKVFFDRLRFLYNAKKHYETALRDIYNRSTHGIQKMDKNVLTLPVKEIENYMQIITFQEEVTRFIHQCMSQNTDNVCFKVQNLDLKDSGPPTLFGGPQKKFQVAVMVILNAVNVDEGFELAIKIIQSFGLDATTILCEVGKELVKTSKKIKIPHFLACVKCFFSKMVKVDEIILECVSELNKETGDIEDIIKMLTSDVNKINAYLMCDKLKSAYLLAMKLKSALDVRRVLVAAEQSDQFAIQNICKRWLEKNS